MTAVGVPVMLAFEWGRLIVPLAANVAGATADFWMTLTLLGVPADVRLEDHPDGVRTFGRERDRPRRISVTAVVWDALSGAAVASVAVFFLLAVAGHSSGSFSGRVAHDRDARNVHLPVLGRAYANRNLSGCRSGRSKRWGGTRSGLCVSLELSTK